MRVLYIIDYGTVGGATLSFIELVCSLKKLGVEPVVCLGRNTDIVERLKSENIDYFCLGHRTALEPYALFCGVRWPIILAKKFFLFWFREFVAILRLRKIRSGNYDLVHTNSARNDIGCFINKKNGIPHVMHIREFADLDFRCKPLRPNYIDYYNKYTTRFIAISNSIRQHWIKKGVVEEKIQVVYNGVHFEDILESSDDNKRSKFKVVIVGGVCAPKRQHIAVEAIEYLPENIRNMISMDIIGWGDESYISKLKNYIQTKCLNKQIHFLGPVSDIHKRLCNYQIGLMCSRAEGFGRVTAEYMHAQLGVIASDTGANPELIQDGVNGLLFKSGDAQSLANCIVKLYNDRDLLIRISHAAKEKARATYTQQKNAEAIYDVYQDILGKK